ncbi:MAG TPA: HAMP domain-containing sensor histidine kinase [Bacteroidales bacterium]|jgi:signal transduction histidine kinase|nr:HAMP domain-containing histidine kinase [Bacteroidales bacterium]HKM13050.1 HAMP domain-containing sensor histidine kinase [Bacteroidales bacterium]HPB89430.1 HAMP domain-containing sensor histidine kinase [Bacteroidales bacterium]HPY22096.1 HAMP domain-containing sensor histidine kinase [Bacteroidales bacterium]HQN24515.1 HAMP domain-containing sensor histidine kinase [Bacteroidales bacterium]
MDIHLKQNDMKESLLVISIIAIVLLLVAIVLLFYNVKLYRSLTRSEMDKSRIKRQLTQNVAHEIKTPVASIHGYLETLVANPNLPEEKRRHFLERCLSQSERMTRLMAYMSTVSRLDEGRVTMEEGVDLERIINDVIEDFKGKLDLAGISVKLAIPEYLFIRGDQGLLYSIFRNLVENTVLYASGADTLRIACLRREDSIEFEFSDNGSGIPDKHLNRIFERFYRVDKGRTRGEGAAGGTGLGLSIVKNAVLAHGGTISASSGPSGAGLIVRFSLPA